MGATSRNKGARGELEVQALYRSAGFLDVHRNFASGAAGGADLTNAPDVPEVKRTKANVRFWEWISQASGATPGDRWSLWIRRDHGTWLVTLPAARYLDLLKKEAGQ